MGVHGGKVLSFFLLSVFRWVFAPCALFYVSILPVHCRCLSLTMIVLGCWSATVKAKEGRVVKGSVVSSAYTVNQQESFLFVIDPGCLVEFISTIISRS